MTDKVFLDTNLWVYLFSEDLNKRESVKELVKKNFGKIQISGQVLGELFNILIKKEIASVEDAKKIVIGISDEFPVSPIDLPVIKQALNLKIKYRFSYWDSLIISSAIEEHCKILYTEDLQHSQVIEKELKIVNPFSLDRD
jgi:predicted nucleic acid-binding protein